MAFRITYDSTVLRAVAHECQLLLGGRIQRISQPDARTLVLRIYVSRAEHTLLLSCDANFARVHLTSVRHANPPVPPPFCAAARKWTENGRILAIEVRGMDRVLEIAVQGKDGEFTYVAEIMGKHSNVMLLDSDSRIVAAMKIVGPKQSVRQVRPGLEYSLPPPLEGLDPLSLTTEQFEGVLKEAGDVGPDWLVSNIQGMSRFLAEHLWDYGGGIPEGLVAAYDMWRAALLTNSWQPTIYRMKGGSSLGAYPIAFGPPNGVVASRRSSISEALDTHYLSVQASFQKEQARAELRSALSSALNATRNALHQVAARLQEASEADRYQLFGELILAYGHSLPPKADKLSAPDYRNALAQNVDIPLDPELSVVENAERYFQKARKARRSETTLRERQAVLERDAAELTSYLARLEEMSMGELENLRTEAARRRWTISSETEREQELLTFGGHRIRRVRTEEGFEILYGENATANDYLTQKVARPNDWWLHVRGGTSAHAVVPTANRPESVPKSVLLAAARLVARNSPAKHSSLVAVDYTLRKYVRKPRGAPAGTVLYTREKTLHVYPLDAT